MINKIGELFFKARSYTPIPFLLIVIFFANPILKNVIIGFLVIIFGELFRLWGVAYAGFVTRTRNVGANVLVTNGPFAIVRNPLYLGNFFLSLGVCIAFNALMPYTLIGYVLLFSIQYYFIVKLEEEKLESNFGEEYKNYKRAVPRFFPTFRPYQNQSNIEFNGKVALVNEKNTFVSIAVVLILSIIFLLNGNPLYQWIKSL